jgi:membrane associated rhomboid family serine protease
MIPIRDTVPSKNYPIVNFTLIGVNILVYIIQMSQGTNLEQFIYTYGLVPARYSDPYLSAHFSLAQQIISLFTFMFLHGGFWHILGNMWFLYIFGDNVEDRLGSFYYLIFYFLSGIVSGVFHLIFNFYSTAPTIGASGAIAGVMGAYFIFYPRAKILTLIPIIIIPWLIEIPAFFFLGFWFLIQVINVSAGNEFSNGIAWWAHVAGFLFGVLFVKVFHTPSDTRFSDPLRHAFLQKRKSDRLQILRPSGSANDNHLYDLIRITPYEAASGAKKMINIPWGFYNRIYQVAIPAGTHDGTILRLKGLGKEMIGLQRGDLFLKIMIEQPWR